MGSLHLFVISLLKQWLKLHDEEEATIMRDFHTTTSVVTGYLECWLHSRRYIVWMLQWTLLSIFKHNADTFLSRVMTNKVKQLLKQNSGSTSEFSECAAESYLSHTDEVQVNTVSVLLKVIRHWWISWILTKDPNKNVDERWQESSSSSSTIHWNFKPLLKTVDFWLSSSHPGFKWLYAWF
jgi:hypothetical protein